MSVGVNAVISNGDYFETLCKSLHFALEEQLKFGMEKFKSKLSLSIYSHVTAY